MKARHSAHPKRTSTKRLTRREFMDTTTKAVAAGVVAANFPYVARAAESISFRA